MEVDCLELVHMVQQKDHDLSAYRRTVIEDINRAFEVRSDMYYSCYA